MFQLLILGIFFHNLPFFCSFCTNGNIRVFFFFFDTIVDTFPPCCWRWCFAVAWVMVFKTPMITKLLFSILGSRIFSLSFWVVPEGHLSSFSPRGFLVLSLSSFSAPIGLLDPSLSVFFHVSAFVSNTGVLLTPTPWESSFHLYPNYQDRLHKHPHLRSDSGFHSS